MPERLPALTRDDTRHPLPVERAYFRYAAASVPACRVPIQRMGDPFRGRVARRWTFFSSLPVEFFSAHTAQSPLIETSVCFGTATEDK